MNEKIQALEKEIYEKNLELAALQKAADPVEVENYRFKILEGEVTLLELFQGKNTLFAIHNMGQGCRYCTLWADGLNGFLPHLESEFSVVLLSKDDPDVQRRMANERGWRFRLASHRGGAYIKEQTVCQGQDNTPGIVCYEREGDKVFRKNSSVFGPGDLYCSLWSVLSLAGRSAADWTPQYSYWKRPEKMDDGGENLT